MERNRTGSPVIQDFPDRGFFFAEQKAVVLFHSLGWMANFECLVIKEPRHSGWKFKHFFLQYSKTLTIIGKDVSIWLQNLQRVAEASKKGSLDDLSWLDHGLFCHGRCTCTAALGQYNCALGGDQLELKKSHQETGRISDFMYTPENETYHLKMYLLLKNGCFRHVSFFGGRYSWSSDDQWTRNARCLDQGESCGTRNFCMLFSFFFGCASYYPAF